MTKNIVAKIDLILHATEDFQKIAEPLNDLFAIEKEDSYKTGAFWAFWKSYFDVTCGD